MRQTREHRRGTAVRVMAAVVAAAVAALGVASCDASGPGHATGGPAHRRSASPSPTGPRWNPRPASMAALGDSITRGYDACSLLTDCPDVSWATGTRQAVGSVARRLLASPTARSWNYAVSGARMADLPGQAAKAAKVHPALVTVLMGANDACVPAVADMTPTAVFRTRFTAAMETLRRESPRTQVYVASIPDLLRLWAVGHTNVLGRQIWKLGICPSMLAHATGTSPADTARRDAVRARVVAYNGVLGAVCGHYPLCRYDGGAVFRQDFSTADLSPWDWFHPSTAGQAQLALLAYQGVTRATARTG